MKVWKLLASALHPDIPEEAIARLKPPLDALEAAFRPLTASIPLETEPAYVLYCPTEEE
jgi:hypothetical protein